MNGWEGGKSLANKFFFYQVDIPTCSVPLSEGRQARDPSSQVLCAHLAPVGVLCAFNTTTIAVSPETNETFRKNRSVEIRGRQVPKKGEGGSTPPPPG